MPDLTAAQQDRLQRLLASALREAVDGLQDYDDEKLVQTIAERRAALSELTDRPHQP